MPINTMLHKHRRKRVHQKKFKPYPHPHKKIQYIDKLVDIVALIFPLTIIPQILEIWVHKNTAGVSLLTWSMLLFFQIIMVFYAFAHKDKRLLIMWFLWCIGEAFVLIGLVLYG